ncbi:MAG: uncharacterized protein QOH36_1262 [Actinomycetota bacterium]|jgi:uncharacterized membrane protein (UPF0182 family)|nr:uncharacterized protein [Actinomycetota bacterium]MEA2973448.1 uncharacterized protein [Actinomycetota bacterium]
MRAPTDLPRRRRGSTSRRVALVVIGVALFFLVISLRGIAGFYTDYLWFDEVGLTGVWKGVLGAKIGLAIVFSLVFFAIVWANLAIADVLAPTFRPMGPEEQFIERYHEVVGARAGMVRIGVAALFALVAGPGAASQWQAWLLFRNQRSFGTSDALFNRDIGFYVFELPFVKFVADWLFAAVVIVLIVTAVAHYLNGGIRFQTPMQKVTPQVKAHLSVLLAALALLKAGGYFLQRYELVYSSRGVVDGAGYTDVKAQLPALNLLVLISLFACALFLVNILRRGWVLPVIAVGVWALISVVIGAAYPATVQKFRVQPTESTKERPYILRNITATRDAYNLRNTEVRDFEASTTLTAADLDQNQSTIRNIRLWDPLIVRESYKRLQEIRNFYQINDVDVDRYPIDGLDTQALVSVRELNVAGIPSQSWVNQHLVYTHGYGAVLTPSTGVAPDSNPDFRLKDLPPVGDPALRQPAIYYGQGVDGYAIVKTKQQEIDYTDATGANHTTVYSGDGGVRMNSFVRRAALALRFGDMNPLISSLVTSESRAIYVRNIDERVRKAAPFLRFDSDPYPVLLDGQVKWIYDAYTTTSRFPYSQRADTSRLPSRSDLDGAGFNYVRNSVKVVIDAYNGKMTFYIVDPDDPIVKAYADAFPGMFTDGDLVEPELRAHFRYPEDIFRVQTNMFGLYHIDDPGNFYNRTDAWEIAQQPGVTGTVTPGGVAATTPNGAPAVAREARMEPYHLLMRLPGEEKEDFLILQPFVPFSRDDSRKDLTAFMVAKSDPANYGRLEAFVMPRSRQIDGPAIVNARINQQPEISQQITLLSTAGSDVKLGNLLVIPINQSLIYIQPLYVQAAGTPVPQLKKVIVVAGDKVVMRDSLREALTALFGSSPPTLEKQGEGAPTGPPVTGDGGTPPVTGTPPAVDATVAGLLEQANSRFTAADEALRAGDLGKYQQELDAAKALVRQASDAARAAAPPTTAPPTTNATA